MSAAQVILARLSTMGMTQGELAFRAGVSAQFMCDVLKRRRLPSAKVARSILSALNLSEEQEALCVRSWVDEFLGEWKELLNSLEAKP